MTARLLLWEIEENDGFDGAWATLDIAVARFRGIAFGQLLYAGDDLSGDVWNARGWDDHETGRQQLFRLAAEAVLTL